MSTSYGLIIELSRNEQLQKYRIILSQHPDYLYKWLVHLNLTCLLLPSFFFFSMRFLNMCQPRPTFYLLWWAGPSGLAFYGSGPGCLLNWLMMVNAGWLGSMRSEIFLQMKFIIFQGCSTKQVALLPGQPVPYNQLLIQPLLLVSECYFAYNVEARVLKF